MGVAVRRPDQYVHFDVLLVPEPDNPHDPNAIRVCSEGMKTLGYLSRQDVARYKEVFAALKNLKQTGSARASLIGGTAKKPSIGVVIDLLNPEDLLERVAGASEAVTRAIEGDLGGRHYTTFVEAVKALKRKGRLEDAEKLLLSLIGAVEKEWESERLDLAPWYYEQLAIVYAKQHRYQDEVALLERYVSHLGGTSTNIRARLEKARQRLERHEGRTGDALR